MIINSILKCLCRAIRTFEHHILIVIGIILFYIVSIKWKEQFFYVTSDEYAFIPGDKIMDSLVQRTIPNLPEYEMKPKCYYDEIVFLNRFMYVESNLNKLNSSDISNGGEYMPSKCKPEISTAIIIPYRNRIEQLRSFLNYIHNFLRRQNIHYRIFVVEQADKKPFNRAKLFNVGAKYAMEVGFPCLVFHDVDLFPMNLGNFYACTKLPRELCVHVDKFRFHFLYAGSFGGVVSMLDETFKEVNGMSNLYFGWGGEDDDLLGRIKQKNMGITRFGPDYSQYTMIKHKQEKKNEKRFELLDNATKRSETDGLNSLHFNETDFKLFPLFTLISVEL